MEINTYLIIIKVNLLWLTLHDSMPTVVVETVTVVTIVVKLSDVARQFS